jgi:hypothetical protein
MLGGLDKLLHQGFVRAEYLFESNDGEYRFSLRNLTIPEQNETFRAVVGISKDDPSYGSEWALEVLSRAVERVNNVPLEEIKEATGNSVIEKRKSILKMLSPAVFTGIWEQYGKISGLMEIDAKHEELKK